MPPAEHRDTIHELLGRALDEGPARLVVRGGCMTPLVCDGDRVEIVRLDGPAVPGAILLARGGDGELVAHRYLGPAAGDDLWLAGDRTRAERLPPAAVLGGIVDVERGERHLAFDPLRPGLLDRAIAALARAFAEVPPERATFGSRVARRLRIGLLRLRALDWRRAKAASPRS